MAKRADDIIQPDASYRVYKDIARFRGLQIALLWIPVVLILLGVLVWNLQHPITITKAVFYEWSNAQQKFIRVIDSNTEFTKNQLIVEKALISYMVNREKIDHATEQPRFENVFIQSSKEVWTWFFNNYLENDKSLVNNPDFTREIETTRTPNFVDDNIIQIEYETKDKVNGGEAVSNQWVATITYEFIELEVSFDKRYENVLGLKVSGYQIAKRGKIHEKN